MYVPRETRSTSNPAIIEVMRAPLLQNPLNKVMICFFVLSWKKKPCELIEMWNAEIDPPWRMIKIKKSRLEVLWVRKIKLVASMKAPIWSIQRAPYLCTKWPTVSSATRLPIAPILTNDPNSPLVSSRFALTSGKRGTHDMINRPKRKKRAFMRLSSCSTLMVFLKIGHWQALFEPPPIGGHWDQRVQRGWADDPLPWCDHHQKLHVPHEASG